MSKEVSPRVREEVFRRVRADLEPNRFMVHGKIGLSVSVGGGLSLFLCGQMGLGLTDFAHRVHGFLMELGGFWGCTVLCGVLFAVVPVCLMYLCSSRVQFRVLLRKERMAIVGWVLGFGTWLVVRSHSSDILLTMMAWGFPAICSFFLLGMLVQRWGRLKDTRTPGMG